MLFIEEIRNTFVILNQALEWWMIFHKSELQSNSWNACLFVNIDSWIKKETKDAKTAIQQYTISLVLFHKSNSNWPNTNQTRSSLKSSTIVSDPNGLVDPAPQLASIWNWYKNTLGDKLISVGSTRKRGVNWTYL